MADSAPEIQTTPEAADYLRLKAQTLEKWRLTGRGPKFAKMGTRVVYRRSDLDAWLAGQLRRSTSDPAVPAS